MLPVNTQYPDFEANQVLTNENLNQMRDYLDEQTRLTRANLIGIGIACGLDYRVEDDGSAITIYKGIGVTSAGYMIAACEDSGRLEYYKPYTVPDDISYSPFFEDNDTRNEQYTLWELDTDHNNNPQALPLTLDFLSGRHMPSESSGEKVLLLFLEYLAVDNRNCSPNSCDDKGQVIETTVRRLLIRREDLDLIQKQVMELGQPADEYFGLTGIRSLRNGLPELKMRRFNVAASTLVYSANVFDAFQSALNSTFINRVASALSDLYLAFRPILQNSFADNPFLSLPAQWAYLHNGGIVAQDRHLWMQYYYDHIFTVIQAYNEFREKGLELLGLCCPDARLFPRHLMLGIALPNTNNPNYRHHFAPSPLFSRYAGAFSELVILFRRITELIESFRLPRRLGLGGADGGQDSIIPVKITPSKLGDFSLSKRAIPYHYRPVPLFEYWDPRKTQQQKAHLNLGYRSPAWNTTDDFILNPLRYDHEENNFYRIEGHIGQPYLSVLRNLIHHRNLNRLPFDIIALKTGRNSSKINIPDDVISCNFQDLEAIYDTLREELLCNLCESVQYFYDTVLKDSNGEPIVPEPVLSSPALSLLRNCAPNYQYSEGTVGARYEAILSQLNALPYQDLDPEDGWTSGISAIMSSFRGENTFLSQYEWLAVFLYYMVELSETLLDNLSSLNFDDFSNKYQDLERTVDWLNDILIKILGDTDANSPPQIQVDWDEVQDQLTNILITCKLEPIQSLHEEYLRRFQEIRDRYLLSRFAQQHPGLEHKAGVPKGGTFVIVYHGLDRSQQVPVTQGNFSFGGRVMAGDENWIGAAVTIKGTSIATITDFDGNFSLNSTQLPVTLVISFQGQILGEIYLDKPNSRLFIDTNNLIISEGSRYSGLFEGEVIADFYLPYLCCSDCQPITFQLPPMPLAFTWQQVGCTTRNGNNTLLGDIRIIPMSGTPPYQYSLNGGIDWLDWREDPISLGDGTEVMVRDAEGAVTEPQTITLKALLDLDLGARVCNDAGTEYTLQVYVRGGTPPYTLLINDTTVTVQGGEIGITLASGEGGELTVQDSDEPPCEARITVEPYECQGNDCNLPCDGITQLCHYLLWLQPPTPEDTSPYSAYNDVQLNVESFEVAGREFSYEERIQLTTILSISPAEQPVFASNFISIWYDRILQANNFIQNILETEFGTDMGPILSWTFMPISNFAPDFAILGIETYECFEYRFVINVRYSVLNGAMEYERRTVYTNQGITIYVTSFLQETETDEVSIDLPGSDCRRTNRCDTDETTERFCREPRVQPELSLDISGNTVQVSVNINSSADRIYVECHYASRLFASDDSTPSFDLLPEPYPADRVYVRALVIDSTTSCANSASTILILE